MKSYNDLLFAAIKAALKAGEAILEIYNKPDFDIQTKADNTPLTEADLKAHDIIVESIGKLGLPVLSEEGRDIPYEERKQRNEYWLIDPLDGTKEFIKRNGEFTVNIALIRKDSPLMGVVYAPMLKTLYFGAEGTGSYKAYINSATALKNLNKLIENSQKLPCFKGKRPFTAVASRSHMNIETEDYIAELKVKHPDLEMISSGSSIKLCLVAEGKADVYPRFAPTMEWDTAAGDAVCRSAGFEVIDYEGRGLLGYNKENLLNKWFLVR